MTICLLEGMPNEQSYTLGVTVRVFAAALASTASAGLLIAGIKPGPSVIKWHGSFLLGTN